MIWPIWASTAGRDARRVDINKSDLLRKICGGRHRPVVKRRWAAQSARKLSARTQAELSPFSPRQLPATLAGMSDLTTLANASDLRTALQSGSLERCEIGPVDLPPIDVPSVRLNHVRMTGTKLVGVHAGNWHANRWIARGVLLRGARFDRAELLNCEISNGQGQELHWPTARLFDCRFVETPLTNANLGRSLIVGCDFAQSDLNHASLGESMLLNSSFTDARQGGAVLDNANLTGSVLCNVNLRGANLFRANFSNAVLINVDLREANLTGVSFRNAVVLDVKTDRAELTGTTHQEFQLAGTSLSDIWDRLRHLPADVLALMTAALLHRAQPTAATSPINTTQGGVDPLAILLRLNFSALVRELQGRGGPAELAQLRVDGDHVYARSQTGEELRMTGAGNNAARQPAPMRTPDPPTQQQAPSASVGRNAQPAAAGTAPPPSGNGRFSGLEID
ncbi:MAG: pentapeptide repeat-containing protein [Myxococcales bacterium]|nr:pentapeptide repeat-containing protein [Myxococcales bacterium]